MSLQYFTIGLQLALYSFMKRIHKFKRILMYYLLRNRRDWVNWNSELFTRDTELLEEVFIKEDVQLYYVSKDSTNSGLEYYYTMYITLIDDC